MTKSDLLFLAVVLSIPIQLSKFIFLDYSYVLGLPIDYRALSIYFSDIVAGLYLAAFTIENRKKLPKIFKNYKPYVVSLVIFNFYLFVSSAIFSVSKEASTVANLKILVVSLLSIASVHTLSKKTLVKPAALLLKFSLLWQSAIAISQFTLQRSLNLWILGERNFDASTPGIAHSLFFGSQILRPYGTFPHPNVLAAYLSFGLVILGLSKSLLIPTAALILTYSRAAFGIIGLYIFASTKKVEYLILEVLLACFIGFVIIKQLVESQLSSIAERLLLIQSSFDIALKNPLFGIGSNNFILGLAKLDLTSLAETRLLQPVHNIFLLITTENGIIGLILFALVLFVVSGHVNTKTKAILFTGVLTYAIIDHFLWTLHQGQMMLFLILSYIVSQPKMSKSQRS